MNAVSSYGPITGYRPGRSNDEDWYRTAVFYEVLLRAFADSRGSGSGDLRGLTEHLDYLQWLGIDCLWIPPFYPSPMKDGGYDISDYTSVDPNYGSMEDFTELIAQAHQRGIRIIIDLVMNHTSDQHPWFKESRENPDGEYGDFYVWRDTNTEYADARVIFVDTEESNWTLDPIRKQYFWHRFFSHQPDLNYDNPKVREAMFDVVRFWCRLGIDGFRLDAVPYLFEEEGTNCENLPRTHEFLADLRAMVDDEFPGRVLLAEANQWPEDVVAYYGTPERPECHMCFHFPVMPRIFYALRDQRSTAIREILQATPSIPEGTQWGTFLRNHDELTLEMVSNEERSKMYGWYAEDARMRANVGIRRRLAPLLGNSRAEIELANALLLSLPGSPCIYYGDEIAMGDNIWLNDRDSVRTPMQWNPDRNAGFSTADPGKLYLPVVQSLVYTYQGVNVESQLAQPSSLLHWTRFMLATRRRYPVLGNGDFTLRPTAHPEVLAFTRSNSEQVVLCVMNMQDAPCSTVLSLPEFAGWEVHDAFGGGQFPQISSDGEYPLTLGKRGYYWLQLTYAEPEHDAALTSGTTAGGIADAAALPPYDSAHNAPDAHSAANVLPSRGKGHMESLYETLPELIDDPTFHAHLEQALSKWMGAARWYQGSVDAPTLHVVHAHELTPGTVFFEVDDGEHTYALPLTFLPADSYENTEAIAKLSLSGSAHSVETYVYDATEVEAGQFALLAMAFEDAEAELPAIRAAHKLTSEQSNTSIIYTLRTPDGADDEAPQGIIVKLIRVLNAGNNPDVELQGALAAAHTPGIAHQYGAAHVTTPEGTADVLVASEFLSGASDAWQVVTRDLTYRIESGADIDGFDFDSISELGAITRSIHEALAREFPRQEADEAIKASITQIWRERARAAIEIVPELAPREAEIEAIYSEAASISWPSLQRIHGDYHLGQVLLVPGRGWFVVDFEGEPVRPLDQRVRPDLALRDIAGMLRSFSYAAGSVEATARQGGSQLSEHQREQLREWNVGAKERFLDGYGGIESDIRPVLDALILDKALYEVTYERTYRPSWIAIPLAGINSILDAR
ncbi:MAG: maltose alpha-D-glucosyltransferase [Actinomycetaceae bacterium]|nr:maltose alpha-D-glucosyltransferase [Arcanobacterium sp.]MDD7504439.1 maltose alpha-D-glucosyltransferase [Actinomycetaceae bacterium]MDY6143383.1 maltose alpha-D-glucosyltransferase [Arcanobacterium sp.]